jgi:hypothetical protein
VFAVAMIFVILNQVWEMVNVVNAASSTKLVLVQENMNALVVLIIL